MIIYEKEYNSEAKRNQMENHTYLDSRVGFWGRVTEVDSENLCCTVRADTGESYKGIPVYSSEWVNADENKDYVSAERNLPPLGSIVFVLMPTHSVSGAFILCSGYAKGNTDTFTLVAKNWEKDDKNTLREKVTCGGWDITEDYETGNISLESKDKNILIEANPTENATRTEEKALTIKAWSNEITISENGISISSSNNSGLTVNGDATLFVNGNSTSYITGNSESNVTGNASVTIDGTTDISSAKKLSITSSDEISLTAEKATTITAKSDLTVNADDKTVTINAKTFKVNDSLEVTE